MAEGELLLQGFTLGTHQGRAPLCGIPLLPGPKTILVALAPTGRRQLLLQKLAERGLRPQDIDTVVLTHAHWDHMLNIDLFTNAEVLVHETERRYLQAPDPEDWATPAYTGAILERMRLRSVR